MKAARFCLPQGPAQCLAHCGFIGHVCSILNPSYIHSSNVEQQLVPEARSSRSLPHSLPAPRGPVCLTPTSTTNRPLGNWKAAGRCPSLIPRPWSPGLGCVAYRDETGSDFIQTLVEVLRADPKGDLLELLTEVCWGLGSGNRGRRAGCILLPGPGVLITCYSPGWGGSDPPPSAVRDGRTHNTHTGQVRWTAVISLINPQLGKDYISYV